MTDHLTKQQVERYVQRILPPLELLDMDDHLARCIHCRETVASALPIGAPPRLAEPAYLDRVGAATRRLEDALGPSAGSPFSEAMKLGMGTVEELAHDVETNYKAPLD